MSFDINNNVAAYNAYQNLSMNQTAEQASLQKLSSGFRINKAADDAAGLSIAEELQAQVGGFQVATQNAQGAINLVQTADGALNETQAILQRVRDLAVQASNGTNDATAISAAQSEVTQSLAEIDRIASATVFGSLSLLNAATTSQNSFTFQVGASGASFNQITVAVSGTGTANLGVSGLTVGGTGAIATVDAAITYISNVRSTLGAYQNRLQHTVNNLGVAVQNLSASESQIKDTDMAAEMVNFSKEQILVQAGTAMLAQANQAPQSVLRLFQ